MPDISMCNGTDCPIKETCYRYTATPTPHWQAYSDFKFSEQLNVCEFFFPMKTKKVLKKKVDNIKLK